MLPSTVARFLWPPVIDGNYLDAARRRCLIVLSIAAAVVGLASGLRNLEASYAAYPVQTLIAAIAPLVFLACPIMIARTKNVRNVAWFFLIFTYLAMASVPLIAGGMFSRAAFFLLPWAVMATLFLGWKEGVAAAVLVFCTYLVLHFMYRAILPSVYDISAEMISGWLIIALSLTLLVLTTGAAIFQREMERAAVNMERAAIKLSEARFDAEAANRAKSEFLAKMSHEIRTPMNGVLGLAEMLEKTKLTDEQRLFTETISSSGASLLAIINDVLDVSRIEAGRVSLKNEPFELKGFVEQISMLFKLRASQSQLDLHMDFDERLPTYVVGDAGRIRQVLVNLIGNAIKFTEEGHVKLKVSGQATTSMVDLAFTVEDSGIGIPADKIGVIFENFEQVETSTTRRYDGAGLGLPISQQLAQAMGGAIDVTSVQGKGCTFTFKVRMPVHQASSSVTSGAAVPQRKPSTEEEALSHKKSQSVDNSQRIRVLVAEDNEVNRLVLAAMIDPHRYDVVFAVNGMEAVSAFKNNAFDIILMDVSMPVMDGYLATREIRAYEDDGGARRTPIICVTAHAFEEQRKKSLAADMDDYLSKPVCKAQVDAALEKWTGASVNASPDCNSYELEPLALSRS